METFKSIAISTEIYSGSNYSFETMRDSEAGKPDIVLERYLMLMYEEKPGVSPVLLFELSI